MKSQGQCLRASLLLLALWTACMAQFPSMAVLIASAETPTAPRPAPTLLPAAGPLKVGYIRSWSFAPIFLAADKGYFGEQGLAVDLQEFRSGSNTIAFLSTGQLDAGGGEVGSALFNAIGQGLDVRVVATLSSEPRGYGSAPLLVRKDLFESGQLTRPADLKDTKIALNVTRGIVEYLLSEALALGGLTVDDVQIIVVPFPDVPAALANKAVDAAITGYPFVAAALENGSAAVLLGGDEVVDTPQVSVLYCGRRLLDPANREVAIRFLMAYLKGARDLYGDGWRNEENIAILSKYTGLPPSANRKSIPYYCDPNGQLNTASMEKTQNYYMTRGYIELSRPVALSQVITDTFLTEALERVGRFEPPKVPNGTDSGN